VVATEEECDVTASWCVLYHVKLNPKAYWCGSLCEQRIGKPELRRLARRGGVKRINEDIHTETRGVLKFFLNNLVKNALIYCEDARRKTLTASDVVLALKVF